MDAGRAMRSTCRSRSLTIDTGWGGGLTMDASRLTNDRGWGSRLTNDTSWGGGWSNGTSWGGGLTNSAEGGSGLTSSTCCGRS